MTMVDAQVLDGQRYRGDPIPTGEVVPGDHRCGTRRVDESADDASIKGPGTSPKSSRKGRCISTPSGSHRRTIRLQAL